MNTEYKSILVTKDWIKKNTIGIDWQRNIYSGRVNQIVNKIKTGTFARHSLIRVWKDKVTGKYTILDGQHRLEAISKTDTEYLLDFRIVHNCTLEEAIQEYDTANEVKAHRTIDVIKLHLEGYKNPILKRIVDKTLFPINVSLKGGVNSMRIDNLLIVWYCGQSRFYGKSVLQKSKLVPFILSLNETQYSLIRDFCSLYKTCFGEPSKDSWVYKNVIMSTMMKIWLINKGYYSQEELSQAFKRIETSAAIRQDSIASGVGIAYPEMVSKIYKILNYKRSKDKFVQFWEEEILIPNN